MEILLKDKLPFLKDETQINVAHANKFIVRFSEIPRISEQVDVDLQLLENFVENVSYNQLSIDTIPSTFMRQVRHHPVDKGNETLDSLTITFKVTEHYENYLLLRKILWDIRYGEKPSSVSNLVDYVMKWIAVSFLDNSKRAISTTYHEDCLLTSVGAIEFSSQESGELTFSATWIYHNFEIAIESIYES